MYWKHVLEQVVAKQDQKSVEACDDVNHDFPGKQFLSGELYNTYFTSREAETMVHLIMGKTMRSIGQVMCLSPRTIEFYINNMKAKLHCRTKAELIAKVLASDFLGNFEQEVNASK